MKQRNQELCQEIHTLKERLSEETNMLKKVSEERDSYITALGIMTKEINNQRQSDSGGKTKDREADFVE